MRGLVQIDRHQGSRVRDYLFWTCASPSASKLSQLCHVVRKQCTPAPAADAVLGRNRSHPEGQKADFRKLNKYYQDCRAKRPLKLKEEKHSS